MTQHRGRRRDAALSDAAWYRVAARTLALAYFALALVLLWADLDAVAALARSLGPADAFLAVGVVVAAVGVCAVAWEAARPPTDGARADRQRVVYGKRVSVRLDLGGRLSHQKKNQQDDIRTNVQDY